MHVNLMPHLHANIAAFGVHNQQMLSEAKIAVVGWNLTTELALLGLIGLGIQKFQIFENNPVSKSIISSDSCLENTSKRLQQLYPRIQAQCLRSRPALHFLHEFHPDLMIDTSNSNLSINESVFAATQQRVPLLCAKNSENTTTLQWAYIPKHQQTKYPTILQSPEKTLNHSLHAITAALLCDEVRRYHFLHHDNEQSISQKQIIYNFLSKSLNNSSNDLSILQPNIKNALIIGAGGIGMYVGVLLALKKIPVIQIIDYDTIEESNLNRQILYSQHTGKNKAMTLCSILANINPYATYIPTTSEFDSTLAKKIAKDHNSKPVDYIFCCTDNFKSRLLASTLAIQLQIPIIEGACTPTAGSVTQYIPDFTHTLDCQRAFSRLAATEKKGKENSCNKTVRASVVIPNMMIAGLMVELSNIRINKKNNVEYSNMITYNSLAQRKFHTQSSQLCTCGYEQ